MEIFSIVFALVSVLGVIIYWIVRAFRSGSSHGGLINTPKKKNTSIGVYKKRADACSNRTAQPGKTNKKKETKAMLCRFCGCEVPEKSVFCLSCGNKIDRPDYPEAGVANEPIQPYVTPDTEREPSLSDHSTEDALARARSSINDQPKEEHPPGFWPVTSLFSAYLKQNKDYYLRKFSNLDGSNSSAFWLGGFWLFYRKMVVEGFLYLLLLLGAYIVNMFIPYVGLIVGLILRIVLGLTANKFYRRHVVQKIYRLRGGSYEAAIINFRAQKDTSLLLFFAGLVVWFLMVFVAVFLIDLLIAMIGVYA